MQLIYYYLKVLNQKRSDAGKTYSHHEPEVKFYTKGKKHKKFKFGSKASFFRVSVYVKTNLIVNVWFNFIFDFFQLLPDFL